MKRLLTTTAIVAGALWFGTPAYAAPTLSMDFNAANTFSGTPPAGSLNATFTDVLGGVQLKITSHLLPGTTGGEFVLPGDGFYFNFNPAKNLAALNFANISDVGGTTGNATFSANANSYKADGDGKLDIQLTYSPSNLKAFVTAGEVETYLFSGIVGLTAGDFDFLSDISCNGCGGNGAHLAAVHIGNTPNGGEGSAWAGASTTIPVINPTGDPVPEPASLALLGVGLLGTAVFARRRAQ